MSKRAKIIAGLIVGGVAVLLFLYWLFFSGDDNGNRLKLN